MLIWKNKRGSNRSDEDVKRRSRFESRRFRRYEADEADDETKAEKPKWMDDKNLTYTDFVKKLGDEKDPKALAWFEFAFGKNSKGSINFDANVDEVFVGQCRPTQKDIGLEKSILYPIKNCESIKKQIDEMLEGGKKVTIRKGGNGAPLMPWVYKSDKGTYHIIDGHHRWSQVFCFDPSAKMDMVVFTSKPEVTPDQALAAVQAVIKNAVVKQGKPLPSGNTKGLTNILVADKAEVKAAIEKGIKENSKDGVSPFIEMCSESDGFKARSGAFQKDIDWDNLDESASFVADYLAGNCALFHDAKRQPEVGKDKAPDRKYMPQTDDAGVPASQLQQDLISGEVAPELLNVKERRGIPRAIHKKYID